MQDLFEPSEHLWWEWGLILNMNLPLLLSCWDFSCALGRGVSPHSCSSAYRVTGVSLTLDTGYLFIAAPVKYRLHSWPWMWGAFSWQFAAPVSHSCRMTRCREDSTHGHHQMVNTEIRLIIFFAAKDGEAVHSQQKHTKSWLWLRSWTSYCQTQT